MARRNRLFLVPSILGLGGVAGFMTSGHAATIPYTQSFPLSNGNWNGNFTIPQFNSALGNLTEVDFTMDGSVVGNVTATNTDVAPEDITTNIAANLYLKNPGGATTIVLSAPDWTTTDTAVPVGGNVTHNNENAVDPETNSYFPANGTKFTQFIGAGSISLPVNAQDATSASAGGNVDASLASESSADVEVDYQYTPAVPEPATLGLVLIGGSLAMSRRRRPSRTQR